LLDVTVAQSMIAVQPSSLERAGWQAKLELGFERAGSRTVLRRRSHFGPLRVQRPFYPEGEELCHVYVLHPPGGLVGGDTLELCVELARGARALLTTPAATKFYRSTGRAARQTVSLRVAREAACEWFPQETIVFGGAHAQASTRVDLEQGGLFAGWEIACLGRPAAGDDYATGHYRSSFELWRGPEPIWIDRCVFEADMLQASWGMRGCPVFGTFVVSKSAPELTEAIRKCVTSNPAREHFAVSALRELTICRYLGDSSQRALNCFIQAWHVVRPSLWQRAPSVPRIWLT
jgi:urease accessory protein